MMIMRSERRLLSGKVSLLHSGSDHRRQLLMLHGVPTNSELWLPVMERLSDVRVLAPDLPGFGHSAPPRNPSIGAYHRFISELTRAERIGRPVLVGHDLGGLYALTYAISKPERVRALVLLNTTIYPDPGVAVGLVPLLMPGFGEAYAWLSGRRRYGSVVRRELARMYPRGTPEEEVRVLTEPYGRTRAWWSLLRALRGLSPWHVLAWKGAMSRLRVPVLIVWGEGDPYFPASVPARLHADLTGSQLRYIPGAGHFVMLSQPDEVAAQLLQFVESLY